ncbi:MAG: hypothetical protein J6K52_02850 [Clostridia bacterium]|nr:hypothetical protein [Clostridia bacterium]
MKKSFLILLALIALFSVLAFSSCGDEENGDIVKLSFKAANTFDYLKSIDGKTVTINGYMAESSPVDGSFMFLMNLPYQSCPFCVPNTSQLSNTMEVYPKEGESFPFTTSAIKVTGKLVVAKSQNEFFKDQYGYEFNYKIVDASYTILKSEEMSEEIALWQRLSQSGVLDDIVKMYDYVNFLCAWNTYCVKDKYDDNGSIIPGYYLHPQDAYMFITYEGAQYNYGYSDTYFDDIIKKIRSVDQSAFDDLVKNIENAKKLADTAWAELEYAYNAVLLNDDKDTSNDVEPNYTRKWQKLDKFERYDYVYTLNKGSELVHQMQVTYTEFANWLASSEWEF